MNTISKIMKKILIFSVLVSMLSGCLSLVTSPEIDSNGAPWQGMTMMEWLESSMNRNYTVYLDALKASGYDEVVSSNEGYTFIMPDNTSLNTFARLQGASKIEDVDAEVLTNMLKYLTIKEKIFSTGFEDGKVKMFDTDAGLPMGIYMSNSGSVPYQLTINKNVPEQEFGFTVVSTQITVQDIDFKDHIAHGVEKIPSWEWTDKIPDEPAEPEIPEPTDRLKSPVLTVMEYSLLSSEQAYVTWEAVEGASGYIVTVDGEEVTCETNKVDLTGKFGDFTVKVIAVSSTPETLGNSDPAEVVVHLYSDFGSGSESDPIKIYKAQDWIDFATTVNEGTSYEGQFVKLMNDIDFNGQVIVPAGLSSDVKFCGTLEGNGCMMKNAYINSDGTQGSGLFRYASATIRNLTMSNFNVVSYKGKGAIIVGLTFTGKMENCKVLGCKASAVNASADSPNDGGGMGGFVAQMEGSESIITNCLLQNSDISCRGDAVGGFVGNSKAGTISNCISEKNKITSSNKSPGGIAGTADKTTINSCISRNNVITAGNRYLGGLVAQLYASTVINCISTDNTCILGESSMRVAGGLVGRVEKEKAAVIVNCYSAGNYLSQTNTGKNQPCIALAVGSDMDVVSTKNSYVLANCFIASGEISSAKKASSYMGIVLGINDTPNVTNCFYNESLRTTIDVSAVGSTARYGVGENGDNDNVDIEGTIAVSAAEIVKTTGDDALINRLNKYVNENIGTYPLLKQWKMDGTAPTLSL